MKKSNYIGLACTGHDNALAIVDSNGKLVFAEAAERYLQNKRAVNYQADDFFRISELVEQYCEPGADIVIAKSWSNRVSEILSQEHKRANSAEEEYSGKYSAWLERFKLYSYFCGFVASNVKQNGSNLIAYCNASGRNTSTRGYDHHLCHAATGLYTSPFENAVCVVIDGFGEGTALSFYSYKNGEISRICKDPEPLGGMQSIGLFYGFLTELCGFSPLAGEEWKVMGLAPYGQLDENALDAMKQYIQVDGLQFIFPETAEAAHTELFSFARKTGESTISAANLARTGQYYFGELMNQILCNLHKQNPSDNLVLSGGCALNSSYAGKIVNSTPFENLHIFSAPADDGNAVGAAYLAYFDSNQDTKPETNFHSPYLGSKMAELSLDNLEKFSHINKIQKLGSNRLYQKTAKILSEGKIIGWAQGRAEFGPRALGNRSILADPRHADMKDKINAKVKFREEFRPFAPSILHEFGDEYFQNYQVTPYMERTLLFREEVRNRVPAVVHEDGSGRLQTVRKEWNEPYYNLINSFYEITGIPILLNTSLNIMGKPIVHSVEDAIAILYTTGLDAMVIGNILIEKE